MSTRSRHCSFRPSVALAAATTLGAMGAWTVFAMTGTVRIAKWTRPSPVLEWGGPVFQSTERIGSHSERTLYSSWKLSPLALASEQNDVMFSTTDRLEEDWLPRWAPTELSNPRGTTQEDAAIAVGWPMEMAWASESMILLSRGVPAAKSSKKFGFFPAGIAAFFVANLGIWFTIFRVRASWAGSLHRRGHCLRCGYLVGATESIACPECGHPRPVTRI